MHITHYTYQVYIYLLYILAADDDVHHLASLHRDLSRDVTGASPVPRPACSPNPDKKRHFYSIDSQTLPTRSASSSFIRPPDVAIVTQ